MGSFATLEPVGREATSSIIASMIRQRIMDGTFPQGMQLTESQLAGRLGVSRGPVREAMQRLIQEGLLRNERHRGVFVVTLDEQDVADIYAARSAIERAALARLASNAPAETLGRLENIVCQMRQAAADGSWPALMDLDLDFHRVIVEASGSKRLIRIFESLLVETRMCLGELELAYPSPEGAVAEHEALLALLRIGDTPSLMAALDGHHDHALEYLLGQRRGTSSRAVK